jgi:hypothetical protein
VSRSAFLEIVRKPTDKWREMKTRYDEQINTEKELTVDVYSYFDGQPPDPDGPLADSWEAEKEGLAQHHEPPDAIDGFEVDLNKLLARYPDAIKVRVHVL